MNLSPTSRTLFLVQIGTFFSGLIVIICCCLYLSAYPKSPGAGSVSGIACATLAFALISTITTLVLVFRQKSGRTVNANIEGIWVGVAIVAWILASVGGIASPANGMRNASCKVLPSGKGTDDKNYIRACQSMFASTAFCILSALFFIATAVILVVFAVQRAVRDKKASKVKTGGAYQLGPSPSQYRRAEQAHDIPTEEPKDIEATSPSTDPTPASAAPDTSVLSPTTAEATTTDCTFSQNVYQDPVISTPTPATVIPTPPAAAILSHTSGTPSAYNTYSSSGHVPQASYQSTVGGYENSGYLGQGATVTTAAGIGGQQSYHVQQGSGMSTVSNSGYGQYPPNPYGSVNAGNINMYPPQHTMPYPPQPQQSAYPIIAAPHQQSPYGNQYSMNQPPMPSGQQTPVMAMPRPEYF
ncbi:hypothetical protein BX616_010931 [Lobosporangium transversale]|uniref:MARVEL domain-containing protein n=1 Tax=Lobosporangium transversale TaxID=64571 RepID=A0A1Y2H2S8_9FUNG|nr:hypothetical protein BCR41DRAFT_344970 [Lobosporangium transversale]KAF9910157.1 hypothetical protein BX616_010931 [Lobosporangium transversale]ORZ28281.1 hypothetical protein BCR41DRAFT_344970 [Lobosporangium transversale]|eukprot:XP_021885966.1 hypothetical protein BCR41DRAFT_344970 [Lobosporangium transversale]